MDSKNKIFNILSYIPPLFFIGLLTEGKNDADLRFHANQGLVLSIAMIGLMILGAILSPFTFGIILIFTGIAQFVVGIFCIIGIVNAVKGEQKELPLFGKFKIIK
jgi:uncharacterized membrane protein